MADTVKPGPGNLITDVPGLKVGNAHDERFATGVTVLLPDEPVVAGVDVRGGAPGTRDTPALDPAGLVERIDALVLSGGSVFGLEAASGVTSRLSAMGRGLTFGKQPWPTPVVPAAILFDLMFGPDKQWGETPPYRQLGLQALDAADVAFDLGNAGAGYGATAGTLKGGLGSASARFGGFTCGALVAVNPVGACIDPRTGDLWARAFELHGEFGAASPVRPDMADLTPLAGSKIAGLHAGANTTIAIVAADAVLTRAEATRLAIMAADGMARAIRPVHTPFDGDTVFAVSTGRRELGANRAGELAMLGSLAADCLARAIDRAIALARPLHGWPAWTDG
ncbi:MAG: P1 family peptidase [Anderseniella sp.]|jgi:L-aminopeptidase/D-esterase-like protein|nr:P1 family peptidase [Anderseniella sp.]